jgi:hypothetical protein
MRVVFSFSTRRGVNLPYRFTGRTSAQRIHSSLFLVGAHFFVSKIFSAWSALLRKYAAPAANEKASRSDSYVKEIMPHMLNKICRWNRSTKQHLSIR